MNLKTIGWIASSFSLIGTVLSAFKIIYCWPICITGNIFWIYWSYKKKEWSQLTLWIVFQAANMLGWYQWFMMK
jgi:nicotinamide riboside transporter PnuC